MFLAVESGIGFVTLEGGFVDPIWLVPPRYTRKLQVCGFGKVPA